MGFEGTIHHKQSLYFVNASSDINIWKVVNLYPKFPNISNGKWKFVRFKSLESMTYVSVRQTQLNTGRAADADNDAKVSIFREKVWA